MDQRKKLKESQQAQVFEEALAMLLEEVRYVMELGNCGNCEHDDLKVAYERMVEVMKGLQGK